MRPGPGCWSKGEGCSVWLGMGQMFSNGNKLPVSLKEEVFPPSQASAQVWGILRPIRFEALV